MRLHELLMRSARRTPDALAVDDLSGGVSYRELDLLADAFAAALHAAGVTPGDRVVIWSGKDIDSVALMQAALRIGAVYVPVSAANPLARLVQITRDCRPALVVADADGLRRAATENWPRGDDEPSMVGATELLAAPAPSAPPIHHGTPDDVAYVLYTSGSTGVPKGVAISHRNALAFVTWAAAETGLRAADRLANHAPFNFDLSVFDLYAAFLVGASVHLVPPGMAYAPGLLTELLESRRITVWYSVPSVLVLMLHQGGLLDGAPPPALRVCAFAGEPFPLADALRLRAAWPDVRLFNWYGPTETNVCTSYEITADDLGRISPLPIGAPCAGADVWLEPRDGPEGEITVAGPTVMTGYWGAVPHTGPYRTGDIGRYDARGNLEYVGRRDHLVKVRGHRVELGEIEAALDAHEAIGTAAVVVIGSGLKARIHAAVVPRRSASPPTLLSVKRHCADRLPLSMTVDALHVMADLPRTPNGKTDRAALTARLTTAPRG
nr:amino acid adenylation domain-containing protein [Streptomyces varsoviensis]